MFTVEFYETEDGEKPVQDFIDSLDVKMQAKIHALITLLEEKGNSLRMPYSEFLEDGIFQIRAIQGNDITRTLYFFCVGNRIVLTNGFVKKSLRTPKREIALAKTRRKDFFRQEKKKKEGRKP